MFTVSNLLYNLISVPSTSTFPVIRIQFHLLFLVREERRIDTNQSGCVHIVIMFFVIIDLLKCINYGVRAVIYVSDIETFVMRNRGVILNTEQPRENTHKRTHLRAHARSPYIYSLTNSISHSLSPCAHTCIHFDSSSRASILECTHLY